MRSNVHFPRPPGPRPSVGESRLRFESIHEAESRAGKSLTKDNLRAIRREILDRAEACHANGGPALRSRFRQRMEREPLILDNNSEAGRSWDAVNLAKAMLFDGQFRSKERRFGLDPEELVRGSGLGLFHALIIRQAAQELGFPPDFYSQFMRTLRSHPSDSRKLGVLLFQSNLGNLKKYQSEKRVSSDLAINAIYHSSMWRLGDATFRRDGVYPVAEAFIEKLLQLGAKTTQPYRFARRETQAATEVLAEPGFEAAVAFLKQPPLNLTEFIENQPLVERSFPIANGTLALDVFSVDSYDLTRVRQFTVTPPNAAPLTVVSKRLEPMKSIYAEGEFLMSKFLLVNDVPTPAPIALLRHWGNTYFLWKFLEHEPSHGDSWDREALRQKAAILDRLDQLGIVATDHHAAAAERNFVVTNDNGKPKVWIIDCERMSFRKDL